MAPFVVRTPAPLFIPLTDDWNWDTVRTSGEIWSTQDETWDTAGGGGQNLDMSMSVVGRNSVSMIGTHPAAPVTQTAVGRVGNITMEKVPRG